MAFVHGEAVIAGRVQAAAVRRQKALDQIGHPAAGRRLIVDRGDVLVFGRPVGVPRFPQLLRGGGRVVHISQGYEMKIGPRPAVVQIADGSHGVQLVGQVHPVPLGNGIGVGLQPLQGLFRPVGELGDDLLIFAGQKVREVH